MKKYLKKIIILVFLLTVLVMPRFVMADDNSPAYNNLKRVGSETTDTGDAPFQPIANLNSPNSMAGIVGIVIKTFLGILGVLFLAYILYAGYNWMTAQGDEEKVTKAKDTIQRAVIGVIVCIAAYAITYFVFQNLVFNGGILR